MKRFLIIAAAAFGLSAVASARVSASPGVVHHRVQQGIQNGSLTRGEVAAIRQQERQLHRQVVHSRNTGAGINPVERRRIAANARQNSNLLYRLKHNGRTQ